MPTDVFAADLKSFVFGVLGVPVPDPCNVRQLETAIYAVIETKVSAKIKINNQNAAFREAILAVADTDTSVPAAVVRAIDTLVSKGFEV